MQIRENRELNTGEDRVECDGFYGKSGDSANFERMEDMAFEELLDVELEAGQCGLQVTRIGETSPLRKLRPLGTCSMQGIVESGDRIVAIDGILSHQLSDLSRIVSSCRFCEISIFDHRTRLTVSWRIHVGTMQESARPRVYHRSTNGQLI